MSTGKYLVLDIDATLVHTHDVDEDGVRGIEKFSMLNIYSQSERIRYRRNLYLMKIVDVNHQSGTGEVTVLTGIYRPYLRLFLDFCKNYFEGVVVWSAGQKKYVEKMVEIMFPHANFQPMVVYTYEDCIVGEDDYLKKPLSKLYKDKRLKGKLNEKNTMILDDRDDTFSLNPKNGVQVPVFESDMSIEDIKHHEDINFLKFMAWLNTKEVKNATDVRKLKKDKVFDKSLEAYNKLLKEEKKRA